MAVVHHVVVVPGEHRSRDRGQQVHPPACRADVPVVLNAHEGTRVFEAPDAGALELAEQDEDRLRLILHAWERSPDAVWSDDPDSDDERLRRRIAQLEDRLLAIDRELAELERSAIAQLERKIGDAKRQGWDLVAEMVQEMKRDIRKATARLASLQFNAGR